LTRTQFIPFQLLLVSLLVCVYYGQSRGGTMRVKNLM